MDFSYDVVLVFQFLILIETYFSRFIFNLIYKKFKSNQFNVFITNLVFIHGLKHDSNFTIYLVFLRVKFNLQLIT